MRMELRYEAYSVLHARRFCLKLTYSIHFLRHWNRNDNSRPLLWPLLWIWPAILI